jgi:predicted TIM-barrel fold metal-dependent hydrolase
MSPRLDAHAHFFYPGFVQGLPDSCRRRSPDEITLYQAFAQRHQIDHVLAIGYQGEPWASGNNDYLAGLAQEHTWLRPLAFVSAPQQLTLSQIERWQAQRFVGITFYLFSPENIDALRQISNELWQWLSEHAWLISVNSTGEYWRGWQPILAAHPGLRLLIAHLGLPPAVPSAPTMEQARAALASVIELAQYSHTYVKFSGFYGLTQPSYAYPHSAAWPYARVVCDSFGTARILWASDFSPALEHVSFPQTVEVLAAMEWLTDDDLQAIYHGNLLRLLAAFEERNPQK